MLTGILVSAFRLTYKILLRMYDFFVSYTK